MQTQSPEAAEEVIGDFEFGALRNPMLREVRKKFGIKAFRRCSVMMEFEHFLNRIKPAGRTCLEIGTFQGISAVVLAQYFERVICVSWDDDSTVIIKRDIAAHLGLSDRIRFFDCKDEEDKRRLVEKFDFDFCYMDGNHLRDTYTDFELVNRCGRVLFHEYWEIQPSVWNLVNSLPQNEIMRADFDCFAYWQRGGIPQPAMRAWDSR